MAKVKVAINGYGVIGKRVAEAVQKQDDMEVVGVVKTSPNYIAQTAVEKGFKVYVPDSNGLERFKSAGVPCEGLSEDLFKDCDVILDCTPGKVGATYKELYTRLGKKAIYQGGEKPEVAEASFTAQVNYDKSVGKQFVRVVSCNTTGLARTLNAINNAYGIEDTRAILIRRGPDPDDIKTGPVNAIVPETKIPSHQGPDLQTVLDVPIETIAIKVPTTLMHMHVVTVKLKNPPKDVSEVVEMFNKAPRIVLINGKDGFKSTAHIMDWARDHSEARGRDDLYEIRVWGDAMSLRGNELTFMQAIHNESDVVPETVDAIRAVMELCDAKTSIEKTDKALSIA